MNSQEIYRFLKKQNIPFEFAEHKAVFNMAEMAEVGLPHPEAEAKNLFVRDDKKRNYYLITVKGDKKANLKEFRRVNGLRPLTFASVEDLMAMMGLSPGAVTPLGLLNDSENRVKFYLDSSFGDGLIGVHPNDNTATVWMKASDLVRIIRETGNDVEFVTIE